MAKINDLKIPTRINLVLGLALLALVWLAGQSLIGKWESLNEAADIRNLATFSTNVSAFVHELQKERGMSAGFIASGCARGGKRAKSGLTIKNTSTTPHNSGVK